MDIERETDCWQVDEDTSWINSNKKGECYDYTLGNEHKSCKRVANAIHSREQGGNEVAIESRVWANTHCVCLSIVSLGCALSPSRCCPSSGVCPSYCPPLVACTSIFPLQSTVSVLEEETVSRTPSPHMAHLKAGQREKKRSQFTRRM